MRLCFLVLLAMASSTAVAQPLPPESVPPAVTLYQQAFRAEREGRGQDAVKLYTSAARTGDAKAARRLADIYDRGIPGVSRDYVEFLKWDNAARALGERMIGDFPDRKRGY